MGKCNEKLGSLSCKTLLVNQECSRALNDCCISTRVSGKQKIPKTPNCKKKYGKNNCSTYIRTKKCAGKIFGFCISKADNAISFGMPIYDVSLEKSRLPRRSRTRKNKKGLPRKIKNRKVASL